jgi:hypothetical protein
MEYDVENKVIRIEKELNELDKITLSFTRLIEDYVVVSGYVSILFGRNRASEDIDLLIPNLEKNHFIQLFKKFHENGFECLNTSDAEEAFDMFQNHNIRFSEKGEPMPNIEFKRIKKKLDQHSYDNRITVFVNGKKLFISPIELQIAFK